MPIAIGNLPVLIEQYKYWVFLPLATVEGPIVTIIGGFLVSLGVLNPFFVYLLALLGDFIGDSFFYLLGRVSRHKRLEDIVHRFGFTMSRFERLEKHFEKHPGKTLFFGKLAIGLEMVSLVAAGAAKVPFKKYIFYVFVPTAPKSLLWLLVGFYFGGAYLVINKYLNNTTLAVAVVVPVVVVVFFGYRFINKRVFKKFLKEG
ncbi:MAG: VTT domain-containing protein [Candidatus Curtissbacteria bacterium]|nr:VTT domain-containing protein [Candidatus Curtissbacteria bacterium]